MPTRPAPAAAHLVLLALLAGAGLPAAAAAPAPQPSRGVYRLPFADGTPVRVAPGPADAHRPGRVVLMGRDGGRDRVVAAADGTVRHQVDGSDAPRGCDAGPAGGPSGSHVWIEHANGEWTRYGPLARGSSTAPGLRVGRFVRAGTVLGRLSDGGCPGGARLHFEVAVPKVGPGRPAGGSAPLERADGARQRIPRICGIEGWVFRRGGHYRARAVPGALLPGTADVVRHGVPARDYPCLLEQAVAAGYALDRIDGFDVGGRVFYNAVFRPATGMTAAFHGLSAAQYRRRFDDLGRKGYRPHALDVHATPDGLRYAAIFRREAGPAVRLHLAADAAAYRERMVAWGAEGYRPRSLSVASRGGRRHYAVLYEKADAGHWQAHAVLDAGQYALALERNARAGRHLVHLDAHVHAGRPFFSAVWSSRAGAAATRHGLTAAGHAQVARRLAAAGHRTGGVTGYAVAGRARYAAFWRR